MLLHSPDYVCITDIYVFTDIYICLSVFTDILIKWVKLCGELCPPASLPTRILSPLHGLVGHQPGHPTTPRCFSAPGRVELCRFRYD